MVNRGVCRSVYVELDETAIVGYRLVASTHVLRAPRSIRAYWQGGGLRPPLDPSLPSPSASTLDAQATFQTSPMPRAPKRTVTRSLRFTAEEWSSVDAKLAGRDFSAVARALLLEAPIPEPRTAVKREVIRKRMTEAEAGRARQLAWIGNNLNQIARAINQGAGALQVMGSLVSLEREARRIADHAG